MGKICEKTHPFLPYCLKPIVKSRGKSKPCKLDPATCGYSQTSKQ